MVEKVLAVRLAVGGTAEVKSELDGVTGRIDKLSGAVQTAAHYGALMAGAMAYLIPGIQGTVRAAIESADAVTTLQNSLKLATGSAQKASQAYESLFTIAQQSRVSFTELGGTFASISRAGQELGISQTRLLTVTQAIGQAMTISGGSAQGMQAALTQLGQGLASGTLRGEELNSVMEQAPRLAQALAEGMSVPIGRLREMGAAGEITAEQVIGALEKSAPQLAKEVEGATLTVSQAFTVLSNAAVKFTGEADAATSATKGLADGLVWLSDTITTVGKSALVMDSLRTIGESVKVLWSDVAFVFERTGMELGAIGAQIAAVLRGDFAGAATIRRELVADAQAARKALDAYQKGALTRTVKDLGVDTTAEDARLARHTKAVKDQARAEEDLAKLRLKLAGVPDGYLKDMQEIIRLNQAGVLTGKEYTDALKKQQDALLKKTGATKDAAKSARDLAAEQDKEAALMAKLAGNNADYQEQLKRLGVIRTRTNMSEERYVELVRQLIAEQPAVKKQMEEEAKALNVLVEARQQARIKEDAGIAAFMAAQEEAAHKSLQTVADRVQGLQDEAAAVALSREKNVSLAVAVEMVAIARLKEEQARKYTEGGEGWASIQREIDKRQELLGLMNTKDVREKEQAGWTALWTSLDSTARETFTNVLEGGQGTWTKLRNTAKAVFFDWLYQMTAKKWLFNLTVSASGGALPATANAAGGIGNLASGASSLFNSAGSMGGLFASNAAYGAALGTTGIGAGSQAAMLAAQTGEFGLAGLTATAEAAGGVMGNAMAFAFDPVTLGIAALVAGIASLDDSGTLHTGGASSYSGVGGARSVDAMTLGTASVVRADATEAMTAGVAKSIVSILDSTALAFGKTAGYTAATAFADDTSDDGAWGALVISKLGETVLDWADTQTSKWAPKEFADGEAGTKQYTAALASSVRDALDSIGLPGWAQGMLDNLGDAPTLESLGAVVSQINTTHAALEQMGDALVGFAGMSDNAKTTLMGASGGIASLAANASSYYEAYYSEAERAANSTRQITEALGAVGLAMPATREAYRAQVEWHQSIMDSEPGAAAALTTLLNLNDEFAALTPIVETAGSAISRTAQDIADSISSLQKEGETLGIELLRAQGDTAGADAAQSALDAATYTDAAELAQYKLNNTLRAQITLINDAKASYASYFDTFATVEEKRQAARSRVIPVLGLEIDTADEYRDHVNSLIATYGIASAEVLYATQVAADFSTAFPAVAEALETVEATAETLVEALSRLRAPSRSAEQVAQSMLSLEDQAFQLQNAGDTEALRDRIREGLSSVVDASGNSERSLQDLVWVLQDTSATATAAAAAAATLRDNTAAYETWWNTVSSADEKKTAATARVTSVLGQGITTMAAYRAHVSNLTSTYGVGSVEVRNATDVLNDFTLAFPAVTAVVQASVESVADALARLRAQTRSADQVAGNILSLEESLFQEQNSGDTSALREHELEGLTDLEKTLKTRIWALQDERAAVESATKAAADLATEQERVAETARQAAQAIASEHADLWRQWLTLNEDTAALRALDLAALNPANRALQQQIWELEDQKKAAEEAKTAAEQLKDTWKSLTDSMLEEVRRIRGVIEESSGNSYASLLAQFATSTAQARAGDQNAAGLLPGLSQSLLTAAELNASSLVDLQRIRALTANSLEQTAGVLGGTVSLQALLPSADTPGAAGAVGTDKWGQPGNGLQGGAAYVPTTSTAAPSYTYADMASELRAELKALRAEVAAARAEAMVNGATIASNTGKSSRIADKWDTDGLPAVRT